MEDGRRLHVLALEHYMASLAPANPAWENKIHQRPDDSFSGRLHSQYSSTKSAEVQRSSAPQDSFPGDPGREVCGAPVHIRWSLECGRYLAASRDIAAGEEIFQEAPLVLAPKPWAEPTCLACLQLLDENRRACEGCGAPLCSHHCDGNQHGTEECDLLAALGLRQDPRDTGLLRLLNGLLAPLRTLLLLQQSPEACQVVEALQSNVEKRQRAGVARAAEEQVLRTLRDRLGLRLTSAAVQHICGVLDTNAFVVGGGRALLALAALMNHECMPNTQHWYSCGVMVFRAVRNIPKGAAVTNTYSPTLWGTRARAAYLAASKLFTCRCPRCLDPRELGSHLSSVRCRQCQESLLVPPSSPESAWECEGCGSTVEGATVEALVRAAAAVAGRAAKEDAAALGATLHHLTRVLGPAHYITVEIKYGLVEATMTSPLHGVSDADLRRVIDHCAELLRLADLIDPGQSRFRGVLLLEQGRAAAELLRRQLTDSLSTADSAAAAVTSDPIVSTPDADSTGINEGKVAPFDDRVSSLQRVMKAALESGAILQYDSRFPRVLALKHLSQDLLRRLPSQVIGGMEPLHRENSTES